MPVMTYTLFFEAGVWHETRNDHVSLNTKPELTAGSFLYRNTVRFVVRQV